MPDLEIAAAPAAVPALASCWALLGGDASELPRPCEGDRVAINHGDFSAARAIDGMGLRERGGFVGVSMVHYTSVEDIDRLIASLDRVLG